MSSSTAFDLDLATFHGQLKSLVSGEDSMFCDVRIKCDGGVVAANQLVLAAGSKVFKHALTRHNALASAAAMASDKVSVGEDNNDGNGGGFVSSPIAKTTRNIKVKGISHRAMRNVVKFLNKGTIGFDEDEEGVDEFVEAAVALKLRGVSRKEQDLSDLDLDKAADDVDLFDNEAALSEAVTQAFEVLSRSPGNLDSTTPAAATAAAATMNPSSLFIGEPDLQQILVPQPKKSRGKGGVKRRRRNKKRDHLVTSEVKSSLKIRLPAAKNLGGKAQTPKRPRKRREQPAPPPTAEQTEQEQPLVHVKAASEQPTRMRRLNKRQTAALTKTREKWLPLPTSTASTTSTASPSSSPRMRAKRCMGISGSFWQCDLCEFWHYHKHGMAKHLEAGH